MNFDPMTHVELSRLASPLATPNTLNKLTIPVKLLKLICDKWLHKHYLCCPM